MPSPFVLPFTIFFIVVEILGQNPTQADRGRWELLQTSIGITAMHIQLLNNDHVMIFDRTDFGPSNISLPEGKCRYDPNDTALKTDCTAHSVEYNVLNNVIRPLMVQTDVWCSSGSLAPDGHLVQTGGFNDGDRMVRTFDACDVCDWKEIGPGLVVRRWYSTSLRLPDGRFIIIGSRRRPNYEFYPKSSLMDNKIFNLPFLVQTMDGFSENNLYPFVYLNTDGNLFIFANNRAILLDYNKDVVVKTYPTIPGGDPRNYPSTGSSVLLPLTTTPPDSAEVIVCGGAPKGSYEQANSSRVFLPALSSCGRIKLNHESPEWVMEDMPMPRCMGDMVLLPNGNILIVNGVELGTAGCENGRNAVRYPVLYQPNNPAGSRFQMQNPTTISRVYHSAAILLRDGRVLVGGSNPHEKYEFTGVVFPTEFRLQAFSPDYLNPEFSSLRPKIIHPFPQTSISYGQNLRVRFTVSGLFDPSRVSITMLDPPFNTHSFSMNQRLLVLEKLGDVTEVAPSIYKVRVAPPSSSFFAPSGYYMMFVAHKDIPSEGVWVHIS